MPFERNRYYLYSSDLFDWDNASFEYDIYI